MSKFWKVNNELLEFEEIFYVDSVNGQDYNDGLSSATAFKTIDKYIAQTIDNSACILAGQTFGKSSALNGSTDLQRTYIGEKEKTMISVSILAVSGSQIIANGPRNKFTRFIDLKFENNVSNHNTTFAYEGFCLPGTGHKVRFENVFFSVPNMKNTHATRAIFRVSGLENSEIYFRNCSMMYSTENQLFDNNTKNASTKVEMINCVVNFAHYRSSATKHQTTIIAGTNTTTFKPTGDASYWENQGSGENPDRGQAHIGVFGGPFAWGEWAKGEPLILFDVEDEVLGVVNESPKIPYHIRCANDLNFKMSAVEAINQERIRSINDVIQDKEYILTVDKSKFYQLDNRMNDLSIVVDSGFETQERHFIFSRIVDKIDVTTKPVVNTYRMNKIIVELQYNAPPENVKIYVSNNALDDEPTWEIAENAVEHIFINNEKTNKNWAVAVRVYIERDNINNVDVSLSEIKYTYE